MCDCFHLAFPNWHAASSGAGRRLRAPEPGTEDDSVCDEPSQFTEGERPRPQGSSPVEEFPETEKYTDSDKECEEEHDSRHKGGREKKTKRSGCGSIFEKRSTPKRSKLKEVHSPDSGVIVKTAKDGCAEGLVYGGGGKDGIFIKEVVPESPASKSLNLKEGDQILSATVYFENVSYEDAIQIMEHAQAYKMKLCLKRKPDISETEPAIESEAMPEEDLFVPEMRDQGKTKRRGDNRISWPKFPSFGKGGKSRFTRSHSTSEADDQRKLELSPTTSDTESPIKSQDALKGKKRNKMKISALTKRGRISSSEDQDTDAPTTGQSGADILQTQEESDLLSPECLESPLEKTPQVNVAQALADVGDSDVRLTEPVQHKVELISIDSTLKTADVTVAPAGEESPSGKKKKKEKSELKMKILGKDKSHKKDEKAKSSPKRLKTLGASIEVADQPGTEKSDVIQQQKLDESNMDVQLEGQGKRFKMPKFGITMPKVTGPKIDIGLPKKDGDMTLPEAKAGVQLPEEEIEAPSVKVEMKSPEIKVGAKDTEGSPSKFKMPTFKLPKFGSSSPSATADKDAKIDGVETQIPEEVLAISIAAPSTETDHPSIDITTTGVEHEGRRSKFKLPSLGFSVAQVKGPDIDLSLSKKDVDEKLPKAKTEVQLPDVELKDPSAKMEITSPGIEVETSNVDGSPSKFKLPTFKLPKFGTSTQQMEVELEGQGKTFKMPKFGISMPKVTGPKIDIGLPKKDGDMTLPEAKAGVKLPEEEIKAPSVKVEMKSPEIKVGAKDTEGSPSKFKMPTFKLPKFGSGSPSATAEVPDVDKDAKIDQQEIKIPEEVLTVSIAAPSTDTDHPSIDITTTEVEHGRRGSKFKLPSLGFSVAQVKGPGIDLSLSKKDVDENLQKVKADIQLPDVELKESSAEVEITSPEIKAQISDVEGSSKFKMPTFKLPKFGVATPQVSVEVPDMDKDIKK
ncbi:uncharacterized protein ACBR49_013964 [Aulostomus maculatus]